MNTPIVKSVQAINNHILLMEFDNQQKSHYDISPLLSKAMFLPLKNLAFFKSVKVDTGGYAVVWREDIDVSEYELWCNGRPII